MVSEGDLSRNSENQVFELETYLQPLAIRHRAALSWFIAKSGQVVFWPKPLDDGTLLVSKAKGIYKPYWTKYALSVRQSLRGPYPDSDPKFRQDGTWSYWYFQESHNPEYRDTNFTNRGMMECFEDRIPVGVLIQIQEKPRSQYRVMGVGLVAGWDNGFFLLEGFSPAGKARECVPRMALNEVMSPDGEELDLEFGDIDITSLTTDQRRRTIASIVRRRGRPAFRKSLLEAYQGRCAITGCDAEAALEAAHILPYRGSQTNSLSNGLLLRSDVHTLFDLGLLAVDVERMVVVLSEELEDTAYRSLAGKAVAFPVSPSAKPSLEALTMHRTWAGLRRWRTSDDDP